jgi:hypothetical protein
VDLSKASIDRYLEQLAAVDQAEPAEDKTQRLEDRIAAIRKAFARRQASDNS